MRPSFFRNVLIAAGETRPLYTAPADRPMRVVMTQSAGAAEITLAFNVNDASQRSGATYRFTSTGAHVFFIEPKQQLFANATALTRVSMAISEALPVISNSPVPYRMAQATVFGTMPVPQAPNFTKLVAAPKHVVRVLVNGLDNQILTLGFTGQDAAQQSGRSFVCGDVNSNEPVFVVRPGQELWVSSTFAGVRASYAMSVLEEVSNA
jgi:hypothetical protein